MRAEPLLLEHEDDLAPPLEMDWARPLRQALLLVLLAVGGFFGWAAVAPLDGAAVATGVVAVESHRRTLQHLEGGIVNALLVRDGDVVQEGQVLLRLDGTRVGAQNDFARNRLAILVAEETRLAAEMDGGSPDYPAEVTGRAGVPEVAAALADQARELDARAVALRQRIDVAESQIEQVRKEIGQNEVLLNTARSTLANVEAELAPLQPLFQQQLVPVTRIRTLEREKLRLAGEVGSLEIQAVRLRERLAEGELRRDQVVRENRQQIAARLSDLRRSINEARQQAVVAADAERRIDIVAPIAGTVQQLRVFTVGGVVRPGDPILELVPLSDNLIIRARISPLDIDRIVPGMVAELRFPAFRNYGNGIIRGGLRSVSRDRIIEDNGRDIYFAAEVTVDRASLPPGLESRMSAGMPADVIIPTESRTALQYMIAPLVDRFNRGMRER